MGASIEPGNENGGRARNVELNVVPFIDLMSCLTAFLLVTAVWSNLAQVSVQPAGEGKDPLDDDPPPRISMLVTADATWVGTSVGDMERLDDAAALDAALRRHKAGALAKVRDIEIGAEDAVTYDVLVAAMDSAIATGFDGVQVVDPPALSVRFRE